MCIFLAPILLLLLRKKPRLNHPPKLKAKHCLTFGNNHSNLTTAIMFNLFVYYYHGHAHTSICMYVYMACVYVTMYVVSK